MDILYSAVFDYLQNQKYSEECFNNRKRAIRNKAQEFTIIDGVLFLTPKGHHKQWISDEKIQ